MRLITKVMLTLGGSLALVGMAAAAEQVHIMKVALPDGSVGQIRYVGNVPPRVVLVPVAAPVMPVAIDDGFAQMEQIAAAMDRQMATMMQQAATMAAQHPAVPGVQTVSAAPAGSGYSYSYVSTTTSNGCTQTIETSATGNNQPAKIVKTSSGDCKPSAPAISIPKAKPSVPADTI